MSAEVEKRIADWENEYPAFYQSGNIAMQVDEPSLREALLAFFADGWRYMVCGALATLSIVAFAALCFVFGWSLG